MNSQVQQKSTPLKIYKNIPRNDCFRIFRDFNSARHAAILFAMLSVCLPCACDDGSAGGFEFSSLHVNPVVGCGNGGGKRTEGDSGGSDVGGVVV